MHDWLEVDEDQQKSDNSIWLLTPMQVYDIP